MKHALSLFAQFFALGCTSFGGPAAHLGYFRTVFVEQKKWLSNEEYSQLIALSQFLPGPGSSQVGFAIGLKRMGLLGGILAFVGFTLPSILIMLALAMGLSGFQDAPFVVSLIAMLKLFAVCVVADAVITMGKNFCSRQSTLLVATATAVGILVIPHPFVQLGFILAAAVLGLALFKGDSPTAMSTANTSIKPLPIILFLAVFALIFSGILPLPDIFEQTFVAGSLVFGGGHVVLPLLQDYFASNIGQDQFITGYAAAQAVPGPMFTFATYLGAVAHDSAITGALLATVGIFLPGFILVLAVHKHWHQLASRPKVAGAVTGVNAAVVGLLAATLYQPIFTSAVHSAMDMAYVIVGFVLIHHVKWPILRVLTLVLITAAANTWLG